MTKGDFYKEIVKRGVYSVFNDLRANLFGRLATDSHIPISYNMLDDVLGECNMPPVLSLFIKTHIDQGDRFRHHCCEINGVRLHYFVDVSKELKDGDDVAAHLQCWNYGYNDEYEAISAIVLYEKHSDVQPIRYPKIIKHELAHAAIEYVINIDKELCAYYFCSVDEEDTRDFIEFVCDMIPYVSSPSKKENGINKFISDSVECFGYDAEEGRPAEFIKTIIATMTETTDGNISDDEPSYEEFKSLKDKYSFILRKTDGKNRCDLLGITESMYHDEELSTMWHTILSDILGDDEDPETKEARSVLDQLYGRMTED